MYFLSLFKISPPYIDGWMEWIRLDWTKGAQQKSKLFKLETSFCLVFISKELGYNRFQNLKSNDLDIIKVPESRDEIVGISTIF